MYWRLLFSVFPCVVWGLALLTLVRPMALPRKGAWALAAFLAVGLAKFAAFRLLGGEMFHPQMRAAVIYGWGALFGFVELWTLFAGLVWLVTWPRRQFRRVRPSPRAARITALVTALFAAALTAEGLWESLRVPPVVERTLAFDRLPSEFDGYRIVHMSDFHCSVATTRRRFERIVECVNVLDADMIAITGDFADGFATELKPQLAPLAELKARDGVFACTGNHEFYWDWSSLGPELRKLGVLFPETAQPIRRGEAVLRVGAMDDFARGRLEGADCLPDPFGVFGRDVRARDEFRVLLFHQPRLRRELVQWVGVDLILSGHTHGGMALPLRPLVALMNEGCVCGPYETGRGWLHVSPGTGQWAGFPLRMFNPAEITVLTLVRGR